jgi:catechol 2,3-dioxygenase-like lactoylglutathione lyase family enzyme
MALIPLSDNRIVQVGVVVPDVEEAVRAWTPLLGIPQPEVIVTDKVEIAHTEYRKRSTPARAKIAFIKLGQVTLELIQPIGEPSTWHDQLKAHGPSLHHIAFEVKNMGERLDELAEHGLPLLQRGDYRGGRYAYVDGQKRFGTVVELLEND